MDVTLTRSAGAGVSGSGHILINKGGGLLSLVSSGGSLLCLVGSSSNNLLSLVDSGGGLLLSSRGGLLGGDEGSCNSSGLLLAHDGWQCGFRVHAEVRAGTIVLRFQADGYQPGLATRDEIRADTGFWG